MIYGCEVASGSEGRLLITLGQAVPPVCGDITNPNGVVVVDVGGSGTAGAIRFGVTVPR